MDQPSKWQVAVVDLPDLDFDSSQSDSVKHLYDLYVWMSSHSKGRLANCTVHLIRSGQVVQEHRVYLTL